MLGLIELQDVVTNSVPILIATIPSGEILYTTRLTDLLFGYMEGELVGQNIEALIPERLHAQHREHVLKYSESSPVPRPTGMTDKTVLGKHRDGTEIAIAAYLYPRIFREQRCAVVTIVPLRTVITI